MGLGHSPSIVLNGLVLALDAGNPKSYGDNTENLLLYSEQFDNAAWAKINTSVSANTTTAPDGTLTADTVTIASGSHVLNQSVSVTQNTQYTFSFYVKRGTATNLSYSVYNVTAGSNIVAPTSYYSQTSATDWVRISLTFTTPAGCTSIAVYPFRDGAAIGTAFVWGAQLESGSSVGPYYATTTTAKTRGTTWTDLSGGGNNGTLTNGPTYSTANGGSIVFDGVNDYVSTSYAPTFNDFTVIVWFKSTSNFDYSRIIDKDYVNGMWIGRNGGIANSWGGGVLEGTSPFGRFITLQDGDWHMIASIRQGTKHTIYGDGITNNISGTVSSAPLSATAFKIGTTLENSNFAQQNIAQVSVYNRALTAAEVAQNYNALAGRYSLPLVATSVSIPTTEIVTVTNSKFVGVTSSYTINDNGVEKTFSYIQISQSLAAYNPNFTILIRPVSITGSYTSKQKLYNYNPWPLYLVTKLKDNAAINNITVKETIGDFQRTITPKWYVSNNCTVTTAGGNADPTGAAPTNFQEIDRTSSALIDIQNDQTLRPYIERDTLYVGANSTETINMRKIFGPDRSVITPDNNNIEATFIIAKKIDGASGSTGTIEASINFKEQ